MRFGTSEILSFQHDREARLSIVSRPSDRLEIDHIEPCPRRDDAYPEERALFRHIHPMRRERLDDVARATFERLTRELRGGVHGDASLVDGASARDEEPESVRSRAKVHEPGGRDGLGSARTGDLAVGVGVQRA
jgi:hypothetical protein